MHWQNTPVKVADTIFFIQTFISCGVKFVGITNSHSLNRIFKQQKIATLFSPELESYNLPALYHLKSIRCRWTCVQYQSIHKGLHIFRLGQKHSSNPKNNRIKEQCTNLPVFFWRAHFLSVVMGLSKAFSVEIRSFTSQWSDCVRFQFTVLFSKIFVVENFHTSITMIFGAAERITTLRLNLLGHQNVVRFKTDIRSFT